MRTIEYIVIHCTATSPSAKVSGILRYWKEEKGWKSPGYHRIINADGEVVKLSNFDNITNGVKGYNHNSIHISYIGGINGVDTRTEEQKASILDCIHEALAYEGTSKKVIIKGHRNFPNVTKECPSFNALNEYKWITI